MSLFPLWCDEFEQHNPIILQNRNNPQNNIQNSQNNSAVNPTINPTQPERDSLSQNNSMSNNSKNLTIPRETELKGNPQNTEQLSEKILIKSSNDTRLVNPSEDQNNKYFLVEDIENKTENEFVFSENVNIDTLSYNEPILESLKKKHEKEQDDGCSETK
jgi:hypothetical protein